MTDITAVKTHLKQIGGYDEAKVVSYTELITSCINIVDKMLKSSEYENDVRVVHLASVKALYAIERSNLNSDDVVSFTVGDITVEKSGKNIESAKQMLIDAENDCRGILCDSSFAFVGV